MTNNHQHSPVGNGPNQASRPAGSSTPSHHSKHSAQTQSSNDLDSSAAAALSRLAETKTSTDDTTDLEELEQFAKLFKQRRIKLGKSYKRNGFIILKKSNYSVKYFI